MDRPAGRVRRRPPAPRHRRVPAPLRAGPVAGLSPARPGRRADGEPVSYRHPDNRRRDFHLLDRFPAGLVATGDSLASFNPIYGQGMSSATLHASCLAAHLASNPSPREPAWSYFKRTRAVVDDAWQTSTLNDLKLPHVTGPRPPGFTLASRLSDLVVRASVTDPVVHRRFLDVMNMLAPATSLMRPGTLIRSAWAVRGRNA